MYILQGMVGRGISIAFAIRSVDSTLQLGQPLFFPSALPIFSLPTFLSSTLPIFPFLHVTRKVMEFLQPLIVRNNDERIPLR